MQALINRIKKSGRILPGNILKIDSFLNQQIDPQLLDAIGREFARHFQKLNVTKVITIEASGIVPAYTTALHLGVPMVFARKKRSKTMNDAVLTANVYSYTKKVNNQINVSRRLISPDDKLLIIDDFLATGQAVKGLLQIAREAHAQVSGIGEVVEKRFQSGHRLVMKTGLPY